MYIQQRVSYHAYLTKIWSHVFHEHLHHRATNRIHFRKLFQMWPLLFLRLVQRDAKVRRTDGDETHMRFVAAAKLCAKVALLVISESTDKALRI